MTGLFAGACILAAEPVHAQTVSRLDDKPSCANCRIHFDTLISVGGDHDSFGIVAPDFERTAFLADGSLWLASTQRPYALTRFNRHGIPEAVVERRGRGPGEFEGIGQLVATDEGVLVLDNAVGRWTELDRDGGLASSQEVRAYVRSIWRLQDGTLLTSAIAPLENRMAFLIRRMTDSGEVLDVYPDALADMQDVGDGASIRITPSHRGFWVARQNDYTLNLFDTASSQIIQRLERDVDWFEPWTEWVAPSDGKPPPRLRGVYEDEDGLVWVIVIAPDQDFERFTETPRRHYSLASESRQYDTIVEVIDPRSGSVLASTRYPGMVLGFLAGGRVAAFEETAPGAQIIHFGRFQLRR